MPAGFLRRNRFQLIVAGASYAAYAALIAAAPVQLHRNLVIFSFFPGIAVAAAFGLKVGLANAIFLIAVVNSLAFLRIGENPLAVGLTAGNIAGILCTVTMAWIVGSMHDLRKRLRISLDGAEAARRALAESEAGFRAMFNIASEGVVLISPRTGRFIAANPAMCALFGYTEEEFRALTPEDITPPDAKEIMRAATRRMFSGAELPDHEGVSLRKDGAKIDVLVSNRRTFWKGEAAFYVSFKDVTFLKEIHRQLESKNRAILDFTNMVTHDLRNPLAGITSALQMLRLSTPVQADADSRETVDLGLDAATYMDGLIADLLDIARLEAGARSLELQDVKVRDIVDCAVSRLHPRARAKGIEIAVDIDDTEIRADPKEMGKVFMNLLGNAIAYIGAPADPRITVSVVTDAREHTFCVKDNGIGIPPESRAAVFEKFKRGANVAATKGTGLGLAIVKGIVEAHGGRVWLESAVGEGTAVFFAVPGAVGAPASGSRG